MALERFNPGDRAAGIPTRAWNAMVRVAEAYERGELQTVSGNQSLAGGYSRGSIVRVRNNSGTDVDRFSVMQIESPGFSPETSLASFKSDVYLRVDIPSADLTTLVGEQAFVITQAPLKNEAIGPALISGVSAVKIDRLSASATTVDLIAGDETRLRTVPWGCADIVGTESENSWVYVLLHGFARRPWFGITDAAIANGMSGTVSAYFGGADSGLNVECVAGFGAIGANKLVYVVPRGPQWYAVQAPCP